ncbi:MAG: hypothetical protein ACRCUT_07120 [Spirochaetota bacterium]
MKKFFKNISDSIKSFFIRLIKTAKEQYLSLRKKVINKAEDYYRRYKALEPRKQNRVLVLTLAIIFFGDYTMACYLIGKNPVDIFPSIPVLDFRDEVTIYLPSPDGDESLKETRLVDKGDSDEGYITRLVHFILAGSNFENTRMMTPIEGNVRKVWIHDGICVIDMRLESIDPEAPLVKGSERKFRTAVEKTIKENIKGIHRVFVLENGIPEKNIWENASDDTPVAIQEGQEPSNTSTAGPDINM